MKIKNRLISAVSGLSMAATLLPINANAQKNPDIESKINALMGKMSLDEKVGQTAEMAIDIIGNWQGDEFVVDQAKLQKVIGQYKVGSILNAPGKALTPQNWYKVISAIQELSMKTMGIH